MVNLDMVVGGCSGIMNNKVSSVGAFELHVSYSAAQPQVYERVRVTRVTRKATREYCI